MDKLSSEKAKVPRRGRPKKGQSSAPSKHDLVMAALDLTNEKNDDKLTMRALAKKLDISPKLLYSHVKNKDELYALAANTMLEEWELPDDKLPWKERLFLIAKSGFEMASKYPELTRHSLLHSLDGGYPQNAHRILQKLRQCLVDANLTDEESEKVQLVYNALYLGMLDLGSNVNLNASEESRKKINAAFEAGFSYLIAGIEQKTGVLKRGKKS